MGSLMERYDDRIAGVLSCYDRVMVTGTLPGVCYAEGMTRFLYGNDIRIFDYPQFAASLRDQVRERAAALATQAGVTIAHIAKSHIRKEALVASALGRNQQHRIVRRQRAFRVGEHHEVVGRDAPVAGERGDDIRLAGHQRSVHEGGLVLHFALEAEREQSGGLIHVRREVEGLRHPRDGVTPAPTGPT